MKFKINNKAFEIRSAKEQDAKVLQDWWNNGEIMAHAGFPLGINISLEKVKQSINKNNDARQLLILLCDGEPIGEMNYKIDKDVAEFGIKICNKDFQNGGYGTKILKHFFKFMFENKGVNTIKCDTNLKNVRAQHVYESKMKMRRVKTSYNCWVNQIGEKCSTVFFEITKQEFFAK